MNIYITLYLIFIIIAATSNPKSELGPYIIAVDIGHTHNKQGAYSSRGTGEYIFNKRVAERLMVHLKKNKKYKPFIIEGERINLKERVEFAEKKGADIILSIHHDSVQPHYLKSWNHNGQKLNYCDKFSGYSLFVSSLNGKYKESLQLAASIGMSLNGNKLKPTYHHTEKIKGENRILLDSCGVYRYDDLAVLKSKTIPSLLIECGIIVNREEEILLATDTYIDLICSSIIQGIKNHNNVHLKE